MAFIWLNSLQVGIISAKMSGSVTEGLNTLLGKFIDEFYISGYVVRKLAHFLEFAVLGLLFCINFCYVFDIKKTDTQKRRSLLWLALPCSVTVAGIDECIQLFVEGRGGSFTDVLIDSSGSLLVIGTFFLIFSLKARR